MKRLFGRRDKDKAVRTSATESATEKETTSAHNEQPQTHTDAANGFLSPYTAPVARKRSLFFGSARGPTKSVQGSHSGSDAGSNTLTTRSTSGSSDASSSLVSTPIDEPLTPLGTETPPTETKSWPNPWASSLGKAKASRALQTTQQQQPVKPSPAASSSSSFTNALRSRVTASRTQTIPRVSVESSADSEEESDDSSWDEIHPNEITRPRKTLRIPASGQRQQSPNSRRTVFGGAVTSSPLTRETSKALANLHALTLDALVPPTSAPPLVQTPSAVPFPRSSNKVHLHPAIVNIIHAQHSPLHMEILRKRLLRRIERRVLTATEQSSIQPLATRSAKPRDANKRRLPAAEETYEDSKAVGGGWSKGMKRWAMRPCFEERVVVWKPHASGVIARSVERDNRCGVAALEFSEGAEALAGLHRQNELPPPPSDIYVPASNRKLPPPLVIPRSPHGIANSDARSLGMVSSRTRIGPSKLRPPPIDATALVSQDEDDLPLGMVVLQRRQKEELEERKRRAAAEKAERERKAREEEEKKRLFAEQVAAARQRREGERLGKNGKKDSWLEGEIDALPPPVRPYASTGRSSSNPNLPTSNSLQNSKPQFDRRQTSAASIISSSATVTTKRQEPVRQQTAPPLPSPWTGIAYTGNTAGSQREYSTPISAPATMRSYNMMMLPPQPDPVSMAMFEQGLLHPWTMNHGTGSTGALTPPRALFGLSSSGDSAGSLTPPRFPSSRPSSWGSSSEDVWLMMQNAGSSSGTNPDAHDRRRSKGSMLASPVDERRSRSHSKSPTDTAPPGYGRPTSSVNGSAPKSQEKRHSRQISSVTAPSAPGRQQSSSSSTPNLHVPSLPTRPRGNSATLSKLNPAQANRTPYGLPSGESYAPVSNASRLQSLSSTPQRESTLAPSTSKDTLKKTSSFLSLTQGRDGGSVTTRKSKLFS
ncbi:SubName: Full=Related to proteophosphoglycan ppg4-Leishmania braziliensis {ECO:0000313/EMBL:CCA67025.1} [Serendipita indica DSM 11827]|uniref:Related to proteophosphoglycan ppg4-Leishmania braziliensis n=1 Tax=Serendipita indica (strain DSM 11827) TaxID=1109443 RepID=G4T6R0_SERID|nr:SubName: Full=Related to proteophosphoglycan ppg4-Leishmania braziliensis {ECO:0000313/EMBL:CCA67025.1} [Serendipita indica DSM 11827]CCA67025.1 related to proteophosphoglycan ppg4-Leishmania braziliensis [Serendipita indica DSM 11827]